MNIDKVIEAIEELPDVDYVHCYDVEIRTDDLKALVTAYKTARECVDHFADANFWEDGEGLVYAHKPTENGILRAREAQQKIDGGGE